MLPTARADLKPNTEAFENNPLVKPTGFREYDARWLFPQDVNLLGIQALGMGLGTQMAEKGLNGRIVVGHDYRSYSQSIKQALIVGLMATGADVVDIGLAVSPMAYYAQFLLDSPAVAMVTASHNENGWTGVKIGMERPLTHGPEDMGRLKDIVLSGKFVTGKRGSYTYVEGVGAKYVEDLLKAGPIKRKLKVVAACGNGTAGLFAEEVLTKLGCTVIPLHTTLDYTFPHHNPNPEDMHMLHAVADAVKEHGADVGLAFDGDGDRCGVVDNTGDEIFADKVGVFIARDLGALYPKSTFVVDVKSTGIFMTDTVLKGQGVTTDYWKTGHSHIKRRVKEIGALAGFEKSGHYFFASPVGHGYDDGLVSAIQVCRFLDRNPGKTLSELKDALPKTWSSPTMAPHCPDEVKYQVVERAVAHFEAMAKKGETLLGQKITSVVTVNGVRVTVEDGTWGLVRASSNKPSLVVVVESPVSEAQMKAMFKAVDGLLSGWPEVGEYDQKIAV